MAAKIATGTALVGAIQANAKRAGVDITLVSSDWTRWASASFTGARHQLVVAAAESPEMDTWLTEMPEGEYPIRGHLVADMLVQSVGRADGVATISLEALTVEE